MSFLARFRQWRLENAEDAVADAQSALSRARIRQRNFGGKHALIRDCERALARAERRAAKLEPHPQGESDGC